MVLTGRTFGRLKVVGPATRHGYVVCECSCGKTKAIRATSLTKTDAPTRSCGCIQREIAQRTGKGTIAKNNQPHLDTNIRFNTNFQVIEKSAPPKNNSSGHTGVSWDNSRGLWAAYINVHGKRIHLGRYAAKEAAIKARKNAEEEYFQPLIELKGDHTTWKNAK